MISEHERPEDREHVDRMVNEGLGSGCLGRDSGLIEDRVEWEEENLREQRRREVWEKDVVTEGRGSYWMDVDRMVNEGLGGGRISSGTGLIEESVDQVREERLREADGDGTE